MAVDIATQMQKIWEAEMNKLRPQIQQACYEQCRALYKAAIDQIQTYGVTGNLYNSLVVGCYEKGVFLCAYKAEEYGLNDATRSTLKRGERYNLPFYWSGAPAGKKRAYRAPTGTENYMGRERGMALLGYATQNKNVPYRFVIGVAVEYAKYAETKSGKNVLTRLHDELKAAGAKVSRMYNK